MQQCGKTVQAVIVALSEYLGSGTDQAIKVARWQHRAVGFAVLGTS